jgi:hypothetical protein
VAAARPALTRKPTADGGITRTRARIVPDLDLDKSDVSAGPDSWVDVVPARHVLVRLANLAAVHCRHGPAGDPADVTANVAIHTRDDGPLHSCPHGRVRSPPPT